jgi:hypothetical protein
MRRFVSIFMILLFWLGPLAAILPANAESRLPACCRRLGAHHCAMSAEWAAKAAQASPGSSPVLTAPLHCSYFPGSIAVTTTPVHALAASSVDLPVQLATAHSPEASRAAARLSPIRTRASRGPPSSHLG